MKRKKTEETSEAVKAEMEKVGPGIKEFHALLSLNHIATIATSGKILKSYHINFKSTNNCRKLLTKLRFF